MSLTLEQQKAVTAGDIFAREVARVEQERDLWRKTMHQSIGATQQLKALMATTSPAAQTIQAWRESEREQQVHIRKMLEPLADIRKSFRIDEGIRQSLKEAIQGTTAIRDQFKDVLSSLSGVGASAKMWAQQMEATRAQTRSAFENLKIAGTISQQLNGFEQINKQWNGSPELLSVVGSLKNIQSQFDKMALPAIDWGSAAALAKLLGQEGLEAQLAHLGIEPNGSLHEPTKAPEKGLLSRKQSDAVALVGLLLAIIGMLMALQMFYYQENAGAIQQAKNDEQAAKHMRQLESLGRLVEKALEQAAAAEEERFVVRERTATVRSKPEHGSPVEGKLMPNEVVRVIDKNGKWVEIEYYHWLHEEYRTGWVLKRYFERVPANYSNTKL